MAPDLRSLPIKAEVIDTSGKWTNVTSALGILLDPQMIRDSLPAAPA
jgi:hypothetical protein